MKQVKQRYETDCGVACVAMLAGCSYRKAFKVLGFADNQRKFYTRHHHLISSLEKLGCVVKRKRFHSWRKICGRAIVPINHKQNGDWHWVAFDRDAILDPNGMVRKMDFRGLRGKGQYLLVDELS